MAPLSHRGEVSLAAGWSSPAGLPWRARSSFRILAMSIPCLEQPALQRSMLFESRHGKTRHAGCRFVLFGFEPFCSWDVLAVSTKIREPGMGLIKLRGVP
jgi:hypothetical protein